MIHLDTNFIILAFQPGTPEERQLRRWLATNNLSDFVRFQSFGLQVVAAPP
jgi:hypothetical protein